MYVAAEIRPRIASIAPATTINKVLPSSAITSFLVGGILLEVDEIYHRPLTCLGAVQDFTLEYHGGRSTAVQRHTEDTAFLTKQTGALAVGQTCGFAVCVSAFRDDNPDVAGVTIGTDKGLTRELRLQSRGLARAIYLKTLWSRT